MLEPELVALSNKLKSAETELDGLPENAGWPDRVLAEHGVGLAREEILAARLADTDARLSTMLDDDPVRQALRPRSEKKPALDEIKNVKVAREALAARLANERTSNQTRREQIAGAIYASRLLAEQTRRAQEAAAAKRAEEKAAHDRKWHFQIEARKKRGLIGG